ncbi:MAG: hypothetical protein MZV63_05905 [Marinilabiliales bacterium]|nr:hypothetical protein [Marinilabiliales bacterium]
MPVKQGLFMWIISAQWQMNATDFQKYAEDGVHPTKEGYKVMENTG